MRTAVRRVANAAVRRLLPPGGSAGRSVVDPISREFGLDRGEPIDRHYIASFLDANRGSITGVALEIAEPTYASRYRDQLSRVEILHIADMPGTTIRGDLARPETLPEGLADCFICTQTFPFIFDVAAAVRGAYRVLAPGGTLLATVSGISQVSRYDMDRWGDYWRFTQRSARMLMELAFRPEDVHVEAYGNVAAAKAFLDGLCVEDLVDRTVLEHHDPDYPVTIGIRARRAA